MKIIVRKRVLCVVHVDYKNCHKPKPHRLNKNNTPQSNAIQYQEYHFYYPSNQLCPRF